MCVKKSDWKTIEMSSQSIVVEIDIIISDKEYAGILKGFKPVEMEDKWFIYHENNVVYFHRSWTGFCIYMLEIINYEGKHKAKSLTINRDPDNYKFSDVEFDVGYVKSLISMLAFSCS